MATAIFYASSTGNTTEVAQMISKQLGDVEVFDIAESGMSKINDFDKVIIGSPTWGEGELSDDFEDAWEEFSSLDFSGKTVAVFGLGDQDGYGECFLDAMGIIYDKVVDNGGNVIGNFDISEDYYYEESKAVRDDKFVGLALDEDNQSELTQARVEQWCSSIKSQIL